MSSGLMACMRDAFVLESLNNVLLYCPSNPNENHEGDEECKAHESHEGHEGQGHEGHEGHEGHAHKADGIRLMESISIHLMPSPLPRI
jgi:hypothetical protein